MGWEMKFCMASHPPATFAAAHKKTSHKRLVLIYNKAINPVKHASDF
jgi:hypothetical protein